ncbi:MAG: nucleoside 2-deoxyribosyltransferase [Proteobacteria bacterium]|nr:nucleoside 2-deoxyribosyltransferase [Pseudomonadota bacterium]
MKAYFAHPCFNDKQRHFKKVFLEKLSSALSQTRYGNDISIVDPFDCTPNVEGHIETKLEMAESIKVKRIRLLGESGIVIALVDDNDAGTAFEAGYAHAVNKPVILVSQESCSAANAMLIGAAIATVNNVLEDEQTERLAGLIKSFYGVWKASQKKPENIRME